MKKLCLSIFAMLLSIVMYCQESFYSPYTEHHTNVIPQTPNATNFTIYGNTPVDYATGIPNINIPLYTLVEDGVEIPISISYHAGGVKVDDLASVVGLKWTLNTGGGIFRSIKGGKADEQGWLTTHTSFIENSFYQTFNKNNYDDQQLLENMSRDNSPDDFSFSFLGNSGEFIFKAKSSPEVIFEKENRTKIEPVYTVNSSGFYTIPSFKAYDFSGNLFTFSDKEINANQSEIHTLTGNTPGAQANSYTSPGVTSWMLSNITTRNGKNISFNYENYNLNYNIDGVSQRFIVYPEVVTSQGLSGRERCNGRNSGQEIERHTTNLVNDSQNKLISSIITDNVEIIFQYSENSSASHWKKQLDKIIIKDRLKNKQKEIHFSYGIFNGDPRLQLREVKEIAFHTVGQPTVHKPPYIFSYDESKPLPNKGSFSKDYWGFYNGKTNHYLVPKSDLAAIKLPQFYSQLADRSRDFSYAKVGVLTRIQYPTGGETSFDFEPLSSSTDQVKKGGLRVKEIKDLNEEGEIFNQRLFYYTNLNAKNYEEGYSYYSYGVGDDITHTFSSEFAVSHPFIVENGYFFEKVEIKTLINNNSLREEHQYKSYKSVNKISYLKDKVISYKGNDTIQKIELIHTIQKKNEYSWNELPKREHCYFVGGTTGSTNGDVSGSEVVGNYLGYEGLPVINHFDTYKDLLVKEITTNYNNAPIYQSGIFGVSELKPSTIVKSYEYNNDLLITKEKIDGRYNGGNPDNVSHVTSSADYDENGEYFWVDTTYPTDYPNDSSLQSLLSTKNLRALPISKIVINNGKQIQGEFFTYDTNGNIKETYRYNKGKGSNTSSTNYIPDNYDLFANYKNEGGKPTEVQKEDGTYISYVWDTTKTYVMAKVENATYSQVLAQFSGSINVSDSDSIIHSELNSIRDGLPNSLVTTYTYDPLIGVTSITDPRGETIYYEYDGFNRLKSVKDKDGNILSENEYNYKN